jgi:hypothetical protein
VTEGAGDDRPDDNDVIIWYVEERNGLDVYRVTKGELFIGQFTGRSIGSSVFRTAVEHASAGRSVWLKDERQFRRLNPADHNPADRLPEP